jgi:hypothetical protein
VRLFLVVLQPCKPQTQEFGKPERRTADPSTMNLVGAPCFSRGQLDFSPAEKQFIPKGRALALDFRGQR